jgi:hypothetical protein
MNKKIDTDKYENMRLLFLDFIDTASDEVDEEAWRNKLTMLDELLAEVKRLREGIKSYLDLDIETHELKALIDE